MNKERKSLLSLNICSGEQKFIKLVACLKATIITK
jgi:hypothetical protein